MHAPATPLPGRLRLRFSQLKQQNEQLVRMAAAMRSTNTYVSSERIITVETSPLTGGQLIHFDALAGKTTAFWDQVEAVLLAHQLRLDPRPLDLQPGAGKHGTRPAPKQPGAAGVTPRPPAVQARTDGSALAGKVAGRVTTAVVDRLIERSAVALVAALL